MKQQIENSKGGMNFSAADKFCIVNTMNARYISIQ